MSQPPYSPPAPYNPSPSSSPYKPQFTPGPQFTSGPAYAPGSSPSAVTSASAPYKPPQFSSGPAYSPQPAPGAPYSPGPAYTPKPQPGTTPAPVTPQTPTTPTPQFSNSVPAAPSQNPYSPGPVYSPPTSSFSKPQFSSGPSYSSAQNPAEPSGPNTTSLYGNGSAANQPSAHAPPTQAQNNPAPYNPTQKPTYGHPPPQNNPAPYQPNTQQTNPPPQSEPHANLGAHNPNQASSAPYNPMQNSAPYQANPTPYQPNPTPYQANPAPYQANQPAYGNPPAPVYGQPNQSQGAYGAPPQTGYNQPQDISQQDAVIVFVREVGSQDYDVMYLYEQMSFEELEMTIQETLGKSEKLTKISLDGVAIRNSAGMKFMFKKADPKLEVSFAGSSSAPSTTVSAAPLSEPARGALSQPRAWDKLANNWLTQLENNPHCFGHTGTPVANQLFVFGGIVDSPNQCFLLTDTRGGKFHSVAVSGALPSAREKHTATLIGKKIYLFGGYNKASDDYYNNLIAFDTENLTMESLSPLGTTPQTRCGHTAVAFNNKMWIFGGRCKVKLGTSFFASSGLEYRSDLICYDPAQNEWINYEPKGLGPSGRTMHTATVIGRKMYVFGGANSTGTRDDTSGFCDLYSLDFDTLEWEECQTNGTPPIPCYGHSATDIGDDRILFFGGKGYAVTNDIHILHLKTMEWKKYAFAGNALVPRWGHSGTFHENRVILFGGRDSAGCWSTYDQIDLDKELIELAPEESAADILRREAEESNKRREIIGGLQGEMEELKVVITRIGEELINQKNEKEEILKALASMEQENNYYRHKIEEYKMLRQHNRLS